MFYFGKPLRWWTSRYEECGGSFVENTIHLVDLLRYLLGDITDVSAFYQWRLPGEGPEPMNLPHVYTVNFRFASGLLANASTARVLYDGDSGPGRRALTVVGDDSIVEWSSDRVVENGTAVFEDEEAARGSPTARRCRRGPSSPRCGPKTRRRRGRPTRRASTASPRSWGRTARPSGAARG